MTNLPKDVFWEKQQRWSVPHGALMLGPWWCFVTFCQMPAVQLQFVFFFLESGVRQEGKRAPLLLDRSSTVCGTLKEAGYQPCRHFPKPQRGTYRESADGPGADNCPHTSLIAPLLAQLLSLMVGVSVCVCARQSSRPPKSAGAALEHYDDIQWIQQMWRTHYVRAP